MGKNGQNEQAEQRVEKSRERVDLKRESRLKAECQKPNEKDLKAESVVHRLLLNQKKLISTNRKQVRSIKNEGKVKRGGKVRLPEKREDRVKGKLNLPTKKLKAPTKKLQVPTKKPKVPTRKLKLPMKRLKLPMKRRQLPIKKLKTRLRKLKKRRNLKTLLILYGN